MYKISNQTKPNQIASDRIQTIPNYMYFQAKPTQTIPYVQLEPKVSNQTPFQIVCL